MKRREPHVRISMKVIKNYMAKMTPNGFAVYAGLKMHENRHTGRCYPAYDTIADLAGLDKKTVIKYTNKLVVLHLITKQERFIEGRQTSNQYNFCPLPQLEKGGVFAPSPEGGTVPPPQDRVESSHPPQDRVAQFHPNLSLEQAITSKQANCKHKDIGRGSEGYTFCRSCYVNMSLFKDQLPKGVILYPTSSDSENGTLDLDEGEDHANSRTASSESGLNQISESNSA